MNVLIIPSWYDNPRDPLKGSIFKEQAFAISDYFKKNKISSTVTILSLQQYSIREYKYYKNTKNIEVHEEEGVTVFQSFFLSIPKLESINFKRGAKLLKKWICYSEKYLNCKFDIIHIHSALFAGIWYSISGLSIPYVITEHSTFYSRNLITKKQKQYLYNVFDNAANIIAVGSGLKKDISFYTKNNIKIIYNIIYDKFCNSNNSNNIDPNKKFTFFSLGVQAHKKGFDILILAFKKYIESGNVGRLIIAGIKETERDWLLSFDLPKEVYNNIEILGKISREKVFEYMNYCDCFSLVSRHETFGIVYAEAMYCGKPVIASMTGGPDSFINSDNGILVPIKDVEKTTEAMIYMTNNYSKYDSEVIKNFAKENFSADAICKQIIDVYNSIV